MAFIICIAALIIMMFVFTKMLLSFGNNSSAAVESVDATVVEKKQGIYIHMQSEAHVPWFRVVFEMTDGSLMESTQQIFCWMFFMKMIMKNRTTLRNLLILKKHWTNCWMKP